jgi:hypothetical protein
MMQQSTEGFRDDGIQNHVRTKGKMMTSVTSVYRRRPMAEDPVKRALQTARDKENTTPRDPRPPHDDVQ